MPTPKFTVAICGGGIAGLMTAIALARLSSRKDFRIDIYEAKQEFTEIGAGVAIRQRPWNIVKALGLETALREFTEVPDNEDEPRLMFEMRKSDQAIGVHFYKTMAPMGNLSFHRAHLLNALAVNLDADTTVSHFSKRLVSYEMADRPDAVKDSTITLFFKDGTFATCDVLIGCDGINSAVREKLLQSAARDAQGRNDFEVAATLREHIKPVWSGSVAYRGIIAREVLAEVNPKHSAIFTPQNYMGKDKHIIVFPISKGRLINVVAFCSWPNNDGSVFDGKIVEECSQMELLEQYRGWEDEVPQLLKCIQKPSRWAINDLKPMPVSVHNHVALAGDAAHAMTPHLGIGAGQGIEDAYILATLLTHPLTTRKTIRDALKVYESVRLPYANEIQRLSRINGKIYEFADPRFSNLRFDRELLTDGKMNEEDKTRLKEVGDASMTIREWTWARDIEEDRKQAVEMLAERLCKGGYVHSSG
ncbi:FAD/NAD-binding domain-containing protein [Fomitiporia mediterranea MF3/22]|uniref:FAD/NAD-binding domain-containing protein n=1 Tax=Fomitiporia mediterranea (strain MF3/22) TaxID=694068 RepID=R7SFQ2_FOMME|nr:FAD/NAD-binding domain-containing protein [Fomitiporia mediterranea MF3/22]EJC97543.1 FAD/NAD-binding domain-containing protein [Fomitiporia mediterranea MF3/22]